MTIKSVQITAGKETLTGSLHIPPNCPKAPLLIICHGFIGSRIGVDRLFVYAGNILASQGYAVLRFDYGGCGESTGMYGEQTFNELIEQTQCVINYAVKLKGIDPEQITLIGHSLGGAVATHTAAIDPRVGNLVLWAPVAYPFHDIVRIVGSNLYFEAKEKLYADYHGYLLSERFFDSMADYFPLKDTQQFHGDAMIIHGSNDEDIPAKYCFYYEKAFRFRSVGHCNKELIIGADHTFTKACHKEKLLQSTVNWLARKQWERETRTYLSV